MKHVTSLLILALLLTSINTHGQDSDIKMVEQPYIEVTGTAEKEIIPDEIFIEIVIKEKYVNRTKITIEEQEKKMKNAIHSLGIDLKNLYLSDANADYVKINWQKKDVLTKKDYTLKVDAAATVGQVFQKLQELEILDASISKVNHSKIDSLKKEVKIAAIRSAKEKAGYLLAAIGEKAGKPLMIKEVEFIPYQAFANTSLRKNVMAEESFNDTMTDTGESHEIQFQKIKIKTSIYTKFSIE